MRTETTYIADDGTKFVNQVDCERYEEECREKSAWNISRMYVILI